jgi:L-Ala-D/L-Glu epimerase
MATDQRSGVIRDLMIVPFTIPYSHPVAFAYGEITAGEHVAVGVELEDRTLTWAEAIPRLSIYGETQRSIAALLSSELKPRLVGHDIWSDRTLAEIHRGIMANNVARGALEQLIFAARAAQLKLPLRALLGGGPPRIGVAWMLPLKSEDEVLAEARDAYARGYRAFKVKGGADAEFDIAIFRKLREAAPEASAYIDANLGYSWSEALSVASSLRDHGLRYLEEPMPIDSAMRRELCRATGVGIIGDESVFSAAQVWHQLQSGSIQAVSVKVSRTGVRESIRIAGLAAAAGVPVVIGTQGESNLATYHAAEVASALSGYARVLVTELSHCEIFADQIAHSDLRREGSDLVLGTSAGNLAVSPERLREYSNERVTP